MASDTQAAPQEERQGEPATPEELDLPGIHTKALDHPVPDINTFLLRLKYAVCRCTPCEQYLCHKARDGKVCTKEDCGFCHNVSGHPDVKKKRNKPGSRKGCAKKPVAVVASGVVLVMIAFAFLRVQQLPQRLLHASANTQESIGNNNTQGSSIEDLCEAASNGDVGAQMKACSMAFSRPESSSSKSFSSIVEWCHSAAEQNETEAMFYLAMGYRHGIHGLAVSDEKAAYWLNKSAANGHADSQFILATDCGMSDEEASQLLHMAAKQGLDVAQVELADRYMKANPPSEEAAMKAKQWYRKAAHQGNQEAQRKLGDFYLQGLGGLPKSFKKAKEWFRKAAEQGSVVAQERLKDRPAASDEVLEMIEKWLKMSRKFDVLGVKPKTQNELNGLHALGMAYTMGKLGLPKNAKEGMNFMRKAALHGHEAAQLLFCDVLLGSKNLGKDMDLGDVGTEEAFEICRTLALQGNQTAVHAMVIMYSLPHALPHVIPLRAFRDYVEEGMKWMKWSVEAAGNTFKEEDIKSIKNSLKRKYESFAKLEI